MDRKVYCVTHCVTTQLPWRDFFPPFVFHFFSLKFYEGGVQGQRADMQREEMNGIEMHDVNDIKNK